MKSSNRFAFRCSRFQLNGRPYRVTMAGFETTQLLNKLHAAYAASDRTTWALAYRPLIKRIEALDARATLSFIIETTTDDRMRLLAIWLRGRCGGYTGSPNIARFIDHPNYQLRKEVVRALKRIHGWAHLQSLIATETDARLRLLATSRPPEPYPNRLSYFVSHIPPRPVANRITNFWIAKDVCVGEGKPPKSPWLIRQILLRIRRLAR